MTPSKRGVLRYKFDFALDCASADIADCASVEVIGGALRALPSFTRLSTRSAYQGIFGRLGDTLYLHSNNKVYAYDGALQEIATVSSGIGKPCSAEYRGTIITSIKSFGTCVLQGSDFTRVTSDAYNDLTVAGERIFALRGNAVYFGEVGEHSVSDSCEYAELPAQCNAIVTLGNSAYALGDTCCKLTPSADYNGFQVSVFARGIGEVQRGSAAVLGNRVVFAASDGLYCLDGSRVKRIFNKISRNIDFTDCFASVYRGGYLLSLPATANRPTLLLDIDEEKCLCVYAANISQTQVYRGKISAVFANGLFKGETGVAAEYNDEMQYKFSNVDFGVNGVKHLRCLLIKTASPVDLYLTSESETRLTRVNGKPRVQRIPLYGSGRRFCLHIKSKGDARIEYLELAAETFKEKNYGDK